MKIIVNWVISAVAILVAAYVLPGVMVAGFAAALVLAVVLGAINAFIKPFLVAVTLPINVMTLGLFTLVINAVLIMLASRVVPGFNVDGFWWALIFAVVLSVVTWVLEQFGAGNRPMMQPPSQGQAQ
jgi:putative membrane protein